MQKVLRFLSAFIVLLSMQYKSTAQMPETVLKRKWQEHNTNLELLKKEHRNHRQMPVIDFYLFGKGDRKKWCIKTEI